MFGYTPLFNILMNENNQVWQVPDWLYYISCACCILVFLMCCRSLFLMTFKCKKKIKLKQ